VHVRLHVDQIDWLSELTIALASALESPGAM
jgi:hypothetical protein